jgi:hypothetical protein
MKHVGVAVGQLHRAGRLTGDRLQRLVRPLRADQHRHRPAVQPQRHGHCAVEQRVDDRLQLGESRAGQIGAQRLLDDQLFRPGVIAGDETQQRTADIRDIEAHRAARGVFGQTDQLVGQLVRRHLFEQPDSAGHLQLAAHQHPSFSEHCFGFRASSPHRVGVCELEHLSTEKQSSFRPIFGDSPFLAAPTAAASAFSYRGLQ